MFAQIDVLGFERLEYELSPDAIGLGLDAALPPRMELDGEVAEFGRGERSKSFTIQVNVSVVGEEQVATTRVRSA